MLAVQFAMLVLCAFIGGFGNLATELRFENLHNTIILKLVITIFQEFYNIADKPPRVFGMTASPVIGKGNGVLTQVFCC